jgi:hypothetical protein
MAAHPAQQDIHPLPPQPARQPAVRDQLGEGAHGGGQGDHAGHRGGRDDGHVERVEQPSALNDPGRRRRPRPASARGGRRPASKLARLLPSPVPPCPVAFRFRGDQDRRDYGMPGSPAQGKRDLHPCRDRGARLGRVRPEPGSPRGMGYQGMRRPSVLTTSTPNPSLASGAHRAGHSSPAPAPGPPQVLPRTRQRASRLRRQLIANIGNC